MAWDACNSGLPPGPGATIGGANTQGMNIDPATAIVLKIGDVYRTTVPQEAGRRKKTRCVRGTAGNFFHIG